ncbi:hypothetical protein AB4Y40_30085 [Paraburkholderia sp. EG287B]|uniref:hypothetical protein n=1 Tax=Paraburkholderia sp. EG287B TaxID=3237010 RepID=UPI0034D186B3
MENHSDTLLDRVLARLGREKGNLRVIASKAGVPYSTLTKISAGSVTDPRFSTVQALHDYFERHPDAADSGASGRVH